MRRAIILTKQAFNRFSR